MAHTRFSLAGPFEVPFLTHPDTSRSRRIESEHAVKFWQDERVVSFANKQGCYIFALRNSRGHTPWYVGKTSNALSAETFTSDKLNKFNKIMFDGKKGTPVMFFVTRTDGRRIIPALMLKQLEKFLIQTAKIKNPDLINKAHAKNIEAWSIDGVYRSRRTARCNIGVVFKKMMGLSY